MVKTSIYKLIMRYKIVVLAVGFILSAFVGGIDGNEYQIKAMFVYNFTKYVEWPENTSSNVFRIGVIGKSEMVEALQAIANQKKIGDKKIEIVYTSVEDGHYCQIIIISKSKTKEIEKIAKAFSNKGVLIIADDAGKFDKGAAINLVTYEDKIRFEINQAQAKNGGVKISSQLLNLAMAVH